MPNPNRTIFVGGLPRSGTTLVAKLISTHPEVTGLNKSTSFASEGQHLQDVYPASHILGAEVVRGRRGLVGPGRRDGWRRRLGQSTHWAYHPSAHLTEEDAHRYPDARQRLLQQWGRYFEKPEASILVEKSPPNVMKTRFLQEVFPGSVFVIVSRHPVMQALAIRKWGTRANRVGLGLTQILDHWFTAMDCYREDAHFLERSTIIRFEDFIESPSATLDFVANETGLEASGFSTDLGPSRDDHYLSYWQYFAGYDRARRFATTIPPNTVKRQLIVSVERSVATMFGPGIARRLGRDYESRMAEYGFSMDDHIPMAPVSPR